MPAGVVFVTATDYFTVHPTVLETTILASSTLIGGVSTTLLPSFQLVSSLTPTTQPRSTMALQPTETASGEASKTDIPPLPSDFATPIMGPETNPWSDHMAGLSLAAVILMVLLLLSLFGYAIYQRFRGRCHHCASYEKRLDKWQKGDLKVITKEMVKSRESLNSQIPSSRSDMSPNGAYEDLERGDHDAERQAARTEALAALTRPGSVVLKPSLWERTKGMMKPRGKPTEPSPECPSTHSTIGDRFFTVPGVESPSPPTPQADYTLPQTRYEPQQLNYEVDPVIIRPYSPPSPSTYSRATDFPIKRPGSQQSEHYIPAPMPPPRIPSPTDSHHPNTYSTYMRNEWRPPHLRQKAINEGSVVSSALNIRDPRHRARYDKAQRDMQRGSIADSELQKAVRDVNVIEKQMRGKRRSREYGGLREP